MWFYVTPLYKLVFLIPFSFKNLDGFHGISTSHLIIKLHFNCWTGSVLAASFVWRNCIGAEGHVWEVRWWFSCLFCIKRFPSSTLPSKLGRTILSKVAGTWGSSFAFSSTNETWSNQQIIREDTICRLNQVYILHKLNTLGYFWNYGRNIGGSYFPI